MPVAPILIPKFLAAAADSTDNRNTICPRSDRLQTFLHLGEGSGSALNDMGLRSYRNRSTTEIIFPGEGQMSQVTAGAPAAATDAWGTHATEGAIFAGATTASRYLRAMLNTGLADVWCDRGTILLRAFFGQSTQAGVALALLNNGLGNVSGRIQYNRANTNTGMVWNLYNTSNVVQQIQHTSSVPATPQWNTCILRWGSRGMWTTLNTMENAATPLAYVGGFFLPLTVGELRIGANNGTGAFLVPTTFANIDVSTFAYWDAELDDWEIETLLTDPHLPCRARPDVWAASQMWTQNNPVPDRVTETSVTFQLPLRSPSAAGRGFQVFAKFEAATSWPVTPQIEVTGDATNEILSDALTQAWDGSANQDLAAGDLIQWYAEFNPDGTNWYPCPGGMKRIRMQREGA